MAKCSAHGIKVSQFYPLGFEQLEQHPFPTVLDIPRDKVKDLEEFLGFEIRGKGDKYSDDLILYFRKCCFTLYTCYGVVRFKMYRDTSVTQELQDDISQELVEILEGAV